MQRFEMEPGWQGQVDFAEFKFPWGKRYALAVILGYSRCLWVRFYEHETMAVVNSDERSAGGKLIENATCRGFADHWGGLPTIRLVASPPTSVSSFRQPEGQFPWIPWPEAPTIPRPNAAINRASAPRRRTIHRRASRAIMSLGASRSTGRDAPFVTHCPSPKIAQVSRLAVAPDPSTSRKVAKRR